MSGARPFQSVEMLKAAMTNLMEARAGWGLDVLALAGIAPQPSLESCSEETYEAGTLIQNGFYTGSNLSIERGNIASLLEMTSAWIDEESTSPNRPSSTADSSSSGYEFAQDDDGVCRTNFQLTDEFS